MAKLSKLIEFLANLLMVPETTVLAYARVLRTEGILTSTGRGLNAADMTASDITALLCAVLYGSPKDSVGVYHSVCAMELRFWRIIVPIDDDNDDIDHMMSLNGGDDEGIEALERWLRHPIAKDFWEIVGGSGDSNVNLARFLTGLIVYAAHVPDLFKDYFSRLEVCIDTTSSVAEVRIWPTRPCFKQHPSVGQARFEFYRTKSKCKSVIRRTVEIDWEAFLWLGELLGK